MCGSPRRNHRVVGIRLNCRQGANPRQVSGVGVTVKRCRSCDLIFADPQPIPDSIEDHYGVPPEEYWAAIDLGYVPRYFRSLVRTAQDLIGFKEGMSALDIGAGLGKFMTTLQSAGFQAYGLEPSCVFRDWAVTKMQIDPSRLRLCALEEAEYDSESFDFIAFGAVLEHLYSPSEAIERALRWLRPGGVIQAEVPSSDYLMSKLVNIFFRLRGTNYVTNISPMHPPFHLFEFGLRSFTKHGKRSGYEVAKYHFDVGSIYHVPSLLHPPLRWWMSRRNTGMQLTVFLKKSHS